MRRPGRFTRLAGVVLALSAVAHGLAAQTQRNHLYDKFQLDLSGTTAILGPTFRVDGSQGTGTEVNRGLLGLSTVKMEPRASLRWRMGKRHELEVGYQFARTSGDKTLADSIVFADTVYQAGARVKTTFSTDQAFLAYRFAFLAHDRTQVGVGVGLGAFFFKIGLDAIASASGGGTTDSVAFAQSKSVTAPTGSIGLYGRFLSGSNWYFEADARGLVLKVDRIKATVFEGSGAARYYLSQTFGLEAGYGITGVTVDVSPRTSGVAGGGSGLASGKIKYTFQNVRLGVVISL